MVVQESMLIAHFYNLGSPVNEAKWANVTGFEKSWDSPTLESTLSHNLSHHVKVHVWQFEVISQKDSVPSTYPVSTRYTTL